MVAGSALADPAVVNRQLVSRGKDVQIEFMSQGSGQAIVMLPSLGRGGEDFDEVAKALAGEGFRVIRIQPRGFGRSTGPMNNLSMHDLAADVAAVLDEEKLGPVVLLGHAFGGFVAQQLTSDRPDLVRGLINAAAVTDPESLRAGLGQKTEPARVSVDQDPPAPVEKYDPEAIKAINGPSDSSLPEARRLECLRIAFFAPGNDATVWLGGWNEAVRNMQTHALWHTPVDDYFAFTTGAAPVLALQAEFDPVAPLRASVGFKALLGDRLTCVVIPNASHALFPEQPEAVTKAIGDFARRVFGSSSSNNK